jgi:hypothetical protein
MPHEIAEADPRERRRARIVHHIGSGLFAAVLLAALIGLMGPGPLSETRRSSTNGTVNVDYQRFVRYQGPVETRLSIARAATKNGEVQLSLSRAFVEHVELRRIEPEPASQSAGDEFFTYTIRVESNAPVKIYLRYKANHYGSLAYRIRVGTEPQVALSHFAFP